MESVLGTRYGIARIGVFTNYQSAYLFIFSLLQYHNTLTPYTPLSYLDFILHLCVITPYSHHHFIAAYNILYGFYPPPPPLFFFRLDYVSFYCTLSDIFLPISVSPSFKLSLTLPFYCLCIQLVILILQSHHFILSLLFSKYPFLTTIPDEGLSPKHRIIKFFFKFTYFALESLIS